MQHQTIVEKLLLNALFQLAANYKIELQQKASFSTLITLLRRRLRMSQRTLAKRAKIPQATVSRIESGKTTPSLGTLEKIFNALFCEIVIIPLPIHDLDQLVLKQVHHIAKKRVQYLKGTMALELQQPKDEVIQELIAEEEKDLLANQRFDIWSEGGPDRR
jgi:transcriptional regulator with XRE-family HTH domain